MIIAFSILVGVVAAWLAYHVLFYDFNDFCQGFGKFTARRRRRAMWQHSDPPPPPEHFEEEGWSSGIRFFLFLVVSIGCGYFAYYELQKHFG
jgi:hypothetical protein